MSAIWRAVANGITTTGQGTVGTSAAQLTSTATEANFGIRILPAEANTGTIYYGASSSVTTSTGMRIPSGGWDIPIGNASLIYLIADAAGQDYSWDAI